MKIKILKNAFFLLATSLLINIPANANYDVSIPVAGDTISNEELQFQVIRKVFHVASLKNPVCTDFSIKDTQILQYPKNVKKSKKGKYIKGYWKEIWTVNACENFVQIPVDFYINRKGTQFELDYNSENE